MEKYFTVNAVVLKYSDFSESSRILTLLSAEYGILRVSAKAVKRKGSLNLPAAQLYAFCKYELCRGKNDIHTLVSGEPVENFYALAEDIDRFTAAGDITALVLRTVTAEQPAPDILRLYLNSLFALCYGGKAPGLVKAVFTLRLFRELGFLPDAAGVRTRFCPDCGPEAQAALTHILECDLQKLYGFRISDDLEALLAGIADRIRQEEA